MAAYHQEAFDGRGLFQGIYRNKNTAGIIFSLCACLLIQKSIELRSTLYGLFAAVSVCFLLLSQSKTPIIAITIFTTLYIYSKNTQTLMLGRIIFMIFIASVSFSIAAVNGILDKGILTNRGHIWDFVSQSIFQKPIWGYGYAAYWDIGEKSVVNELAGHWVSKMNTAHNGYLELILHFGFFGYFVTLGLVYVCHFYISRVPRKELFCLYVYLAFLLGNNTESYILYYQNPVWVMFLLVSVMSYDMYVSERRTN
jgi:O-antigen ligase